MDLEEKMMEDELLEQWREEHGAWLPESTLIELADGGYEPDGVQFMGEGASLEYAIGEAIVNGMMGEELSALAKSQFSYINLAAIARDWSASGVFEVDGTWWEGI